MKRLFCTLLVLLMLASAAGCGHSGDSAPDTESYDVDLTKLSSTMVYSEIYNMMTSPDAYIGKQIKMSGSFGVYQDQTTGKLYYACLIADATSCCSQGIEFVLEGDHTYPDDYPEINSTITVTGTFDTYEENGYCYCQLINAHLE